MARHIQDNRVMILYHAIALGSVRAAADKLGVAPSSISRQIVQLESELSMKLIERRSRGVIPTEAGEILCDYYRERLAQAESVEIRLDELQGLRSGHVTLSMGEGFVSDFFANTMQRFRERHPGITMDIGIHGSQRIIDLLVNDQVQIGLIFNPEPDSNIQSAAKRAQPLLAVMSPEHPLAKLGDNIPMQAIAAVPVAFTRESFGIQMLIRKAETETGIRLNPVLRANSVSMIRDFARLNMGITFLPRFAIVRELEEGQLVARTVQSQAFLEAEAHVVLRRGRRLSFAGEKMLTYLAASLAALPA